MGAIDLHAHASADFACKLGRTRAFLPQVAAEYPRPACDSAPQVVQPSSLGAEDMVISHRRKSA